MSDDLIDPILLASIEDPVQLAKVFEVARRKRVSSHSEQSAADHSTSEPISSDALDLDPPSSGYTTHTFEQLIPEKWRFASNSDTRFKINIVIRNGFTKDQITVILAAIKHLAANLWPEAHGNEGSSDYRDPNMEFYDPKLKECIEAGADYTGMNFVSYLGFWVNPKSNNPNKHNVLVIDRFDEPSKPLPDGGTYYLLGSASVNLYTTARFMWISLNGTHLGSSSSYPESTSAARWAGIIIHECLHNFGWQHIRNPNTACMVAYEKGVSKLPSFGLTGHPNIVLDY